MASPAPTARRPRYTPPERRGLVTFAGVALILAGSFNLLDGVVAIAKDDHFRQDELLFGDLTAWGIWWLVVGSLQLYAGLQVMKMREAGMMIGIPLAGLNAFTQLMFLAVYPAWSIAILVLDLVVIYALARSADAFE
jgi:hypothetical protein